MSACVKSLLILVVVLVAAPALAQYREVPRPPAGPARPKPPGPPAAPPPVAAAPDELPYVYTKWKHFTVADGLPNDHIFAVKVDGPRVWVGTEDGLACIDKRTGKIRTWKEKDGLPWRVVTAIEVDQKTGDVWLGLFGGGLARFSGGRFDHFHQLNSGLVNDVVYGLALEHDNVWAATTAGASRYNTKTGEWTIYTEKNSPMEEIWNYGAAYEPTTNKVYLAIWGSGCLEFDVAKDLRKEDPWKPYLDPDGEMEIDLYRDDGIIHVIVTGASPVGNVLWISTYFGTCRYDGRSWRGFYAFETGLPSDFTNNVKARSADECYFAMDKGLGVVADFPTDTYVSYTRDPKTLRGKAQVYRSGKLLKTVDMEKAVPHNFIIAVDVDGNDTWVGTGKGLGWAIGEGYYAGVKKDPEWLSANGNDFAPTTAENNHASPAQQDSPAQVDAETLDVLKEINSLNAYQTPRLKLKTDESYARIPNEVAPFGQFGVEPYKRYFLEQMEYAGPGRAIPEPQDLKTVKIGFIGPIKPTVSVATGGRSHEESLGRKMLQGCRLAIAEANAQGGYLTRRIPFELVEDNDGQLWGASGNVIIKQAYLDKVWAILGTIDGANSHIAIRVALKAEIPMMNSGDTDPTFIETNIPWVFRCIGDDRQQVYLLVDYIYHGLDLERVGIIRASNRYGRFGVRQLKDASRRLGRPIPSEMPYLAGDDDFSVQLERVQRANVQAVVHWGDAEDGARLLNQMRAKGMKQPFFACDRCASADFLKIAGKNAEGVVCGYPWNPNRQDPKLDAMRAAFRKQFPDDPEVETYAAHAYDGMNMLIWAAQTAGLNRAKIRDVLAYRMKPWPGVTGDIPLSAVGDDAGEVFLAKYEGGRWKYLSRAELGIKPDQPRAPQGPKAFFDGRNRPLEYAGPGREDPEPADPAEVLLGYFGPSDPAHPDGDLWCAAQLAIEEANRQGGYRGKPFRLVPRWSDSPWTAGAAQVTKLVYSDRVWAILGGIDGPTAHLAEQVVAKAWLPLVCSATTDRTANSANVPWMFLSLPGDHLQAPVLADQIAKGAAGKDFIVVSGDDHDSRSFLAELSRALGKLELAPRYQYTCRPAAEDVSDLVARVVGARPAAVVVVADPHGSARLVSSLRRAGFAGSVLGGPWMGRRRFLEEAGPAAEGAVFPLVVESEKRSQPFFDTFQKRFQREPDYAAACTYDSVRMLVAAIQEAGLNRARIGDALRELSPWEGVSGTVEWDPLGGNTRPVHLGTIKDGRVIPSPR
jgi:branched-chain amino acid transport system substrate-binding protein